jgi:hypothetical protein
MFDTWSSVNKGNGGAPVKPLPVAWEWSRSTSSMKMPVEGRGEETGGGREW